MNKIIVGVPFDKGLRNDVTAFNIDKNSMPFLQNAYQWRGRVKRKRGTEILTRLKRFLNNLIIAVLDGTGKATQFLLSSGTFIPASQEPFASVVPNTISWTDGTHIWTEPAIPDGTLLINGMVGGGTINYATGRVDLTGGTASANVTGFFSYYPGLPVLGIEDFNVSSDQFPGTIAFDNVYSYNIQTAFPQFTYDVSYYKNPSTTAYPGYVAKTTWNRLNWNGETYQQFGSVNYQGAMWITNGVDVPFLGQKIGLQFGRPTLATRISATTMEFTIVGNPLIIGDFVFANEFTASAGGDAITLNFQTGYVTAQGDIFTVTFPNANITAGTYTPGILQYLTNRSDATKDCIRWYDGDPTDGSLTGPTPSTSKGWVNFMPPLQQLPYNVGELPLGVYYLVGAKIISVFKDRLLFIGAVVQQAGGNPIYLQDTVVYSQNGTPYYTASFTGDPSFATTAFNGILVPDNQTATASAWFEDQTGFGGYQNAGIDEPIITSSTNRDVLIFGFTSTQAKFVYTGNDISPFAYYTINSELGSSSTFSVINLDKGVLTRGNRGFVMTGQEDAGRFDTEIPDEVFQITLQNNGSERFTAQRDFINEWVYFTYLNNELRPDQYFYPTQTLFYNYRDRSWAIFKESYTHYGQFRYQTGFTWATVGLKYSTWKSWNNPWNSGSNTLKQPEVAAGNQQGFIVIRNTGTAEAVSLHITDISGNIITSPDHCLAQNDFIMITGALGTVGTQVNSKIFSVLSIIDRDSFTLNPAIDGGLTYLGGGLITRMYIPVIQTMQFPTAWQDARKTRLGVQRYLFSTTSNAQVTLLIYLSQNVDSPYNKGPIVPAIASDNSGLIYSTVLNTCPESTNLGLTAANINLMTPTAIQQQQIWHRVNTSLVGDTIQLAITLSETQMRAVDANGSPISQFAEIELHGIIMDVTPSQMLI